MVPLHPTRGPQPGNHCVIRTKDELCRLDWYTVLDWNGALWLTMKVLWLCFLFFMCVCSTQTCMSVQCYVNLIINLTGWVSTCGVLVWPYTTLPLGVFPSHHMKDHEGTSPLCKLIHYSSSSPQLKPQVTSVHLHVPAMINVSNCALGHIFMYFLWTILGFLFCRFKITTEKPMGAIAGIQRREGGPIEWSYHLPHSCQLSQYAT